MSNMKIIHYEPKSILVKSKLPNVDYVINPYIGCSFGCTYCYAKFTLNRVNKNINDWDKCIYIKDKIDKLLPKELQKIKNNSNTNIVISSSTDAWQHVEETTKNTQLALNMLLESGYKGKISILTKSPLILRDIDLLKQFKRLLIGITITSLDRDNITKALNHNTPLQSERLNTLEQLYKNGFNVYVFMAPLLPHLLYNLEIIEELLQKIKNIGVNTLFVDGLKYSYNIKTQVMKEILRISISNKNYKLYNNFNPDLRMTLKNKINSLIKLYKFDYIF
jgi:DNA repair photolyase